MKNIVDIVRLWLLLRWREILVIAVFLALVLSGHFIPETPCTECLKIGG